MTGPATYTAFVGHRQVACGPLAAVAQALAAEADAASGHLLFDDATGRLVELDLRHDADAALAAHAAAQDRPQEPALRPGRGRPKLGVVAREVTLLPRHWTWLSRQPGGASAALRRLVDEARQASAGADEAREAQEALYRAMATLAGDLPGFEQAARALFARDREGLEARLAPWPRDVAAYLRRLAERT